MLGHLHWWAFLPSYNGMLEQLVLAHILDQHVQKFLIVRIFPEVLNSKHQHPNGQVLKRYDHFFLHILDLQEFLEP